MRPRRGWGWVILVMAICAIAALTIVGAMVERASSAEMVRLTLRPGEFQLLVRMAYSEARGDGVQGMAAVSHVALNRWEDGRFGKTLRDVLTAPGQFAVGPARDERDVVWLLAVWSAAGAVLGRLPDVTGSAQYFHRADMARPPRWAHDYTKTARIGAHDFYRDPAD